MSQATTTATGAEALSIRQSCATLGLSRSWYYARPEERTPDADAVALRDAIERLVLEFPGYGYRRVTIALPRAGWTVNHKRVLPIMHEEALLCHLPRRFVVTTDSQHAHRTYPNLLTDRVLTGLNQAWVADSTYVHLPQAFVYLAAILDAYSRRGVGGHVARQIDHTLTLTALERALMMRQPPVGGIHHSDRGVQYACGNDVARLGQAGAHLSMSAVGNPYDNAQAESFFKTLTVEEVYLHQYQTFQEAEAQLGRFIDDVYNTKRLHSSLGYWSPAEFEAQFLAAGAG